jgi:hypothetical protein
MAVENRRTGFWHALIAGESRSTPGADLACAEEGSVTFIAIISMLMFVVLIGYVGNVGYSVQQKLELQNAADAASYSTSVWMARGMNAVTTTNHLMGEATALMVMIEGLGGPELDGTKETNDEIDDLNLIINNPWEKDLIPFNLPGPIKKTINSLIESFLPKDLTEKFYTAPGSIAQETGFDRLDSNFVKRVQKMMSDKENGKQDAGAAIYDSQCTIKYYVGTLFKFKWMVNIGYVIGAIFAEPASSGAACGLHLALDGAIAWVAKDWVIVKGIEILARPLQQVEKASPYLLLALSLYGDSVAKPGQLEQPIADTLSQLKKDHRLAELVVFPAPEDLVLPLVVEEPPKKDAASKSVPPTLWTEDEAEKYSKFIKIINAPEHALQRAIDKVNDWLSAFKVVKWLSNGNIDLELPSVQEIKEKMGFPVKYVRLDDSNKLGGMKPGGYGFPQNFSLPNREALPEIDWEAERYSQWARATYPYVDSFRGAWCKFFSDIMGPSNFWTYYKNWTNRYTLAMSYRIRSGAIFPTSFQNLSNKPQLDKLRERTRAWQEEVRKLRARFEAANKGAETLDELLGFDKDEFAEISRDLGTLADRISSELAGATGIDTGALSSWTQAVKSQSKPVDDAKSDANAGFDPDSALEKGDFADLFGKTAMVEVTDYLLSLLESLLRKFDNALAILDFGPPHMYVMRDMVPVSKGNEPWTSDSQMAADLFTVAAVAHREPWKPPYSPAIYSTPYRKLGTVAFSQSMFYAGNGRRTILPAGSSDVQPDTGWDTLNWEPPIQAVEWGRGSPSHSGSQPFNVFTGDFKPLRLARVKINWQAKLVPLTDARASGAALEFATSTKREPIKVSTQLFQH